MKRLGIFLFYDSKGRVSEHMKLSLRAFRPHMEDVVFVANGSFDETSFPEASDLVTHILKRENKGFDVWGYKEGLEYIGFDKFADYDEIVLFNYTFFAPFHDLEIMFSDMASRDIDFWGMTEYTDARKSFLQSYFLVTRKALHCSDQFKDYWETMPMINSIDDSLELHEFRFSKWFAENGFRYEPYVKNDPDWDGNTTLCDVPAMVGRGMPIIKYRAFNFEENVIERRGGLTPAENFRFVAEQTSYPVDVIWDYIISHTTSNSLTTNLDIFRALTESAKPLPQDVVYAVSLSAPEQFDVARRYLESLPRDRVFVATPYTEILQGLESLGFKARLSDSRSLGLYSWLTEIAESNDINFVVNLSDFEGERARYHFIDRLFEVYWGPFVGAKNCFEDVKDWFLEQPYLGMIHPVTDTVDGREFFNKPLGTSQRSILDTEEFSHLTPAIGCSSWPWRGNMVLRHEVVKNRIFQNDLEFLAKNYALRPLGNAASFEAYFPEMVRATGHVTGVNSRSNDLAKLVLRGVTLNSTWNMRIGKNAENFRKNLIAAQNFRNEAQAEIEELKGQLRKREVGEAPPEPSRAVTGLKRLSNKILPKKADIDILTSDIKLSVVRWKSPKLMITAESGKALQLSSSNFANFAVDEFSHTDSKIKVVGWCFDNNVPASRIYCGVFADQELISPLAIADYPRPDVSDTFASQGVGQDVGFYIDRRFGFDGPGTSHTFRLVFINEQLTKSMVIDLSNGSSTKHI